MAEEFVKPITKFDYFKIKGITIDPTNIINLDIFESLNTPGITGNLVLQDWSALKEFSNISAGDDIEFSFARSNDPLVSVKYVISESNDAAPNESLHNVVSFGFMSPWLLQATTRKRSRPFRNKRIDEIISELIVECGGETLIFTETKQTLERFVTPHWTPLESIRYLMSFAMSQENNEGGYILWTDLESDKVNFMPISQLMDGQYGESGIDLKFNPVDQRSPHKLINLVMDQNFNVAKYGDMGLGRSRLVGFNFDKTEVMNVDERIDEHGLRLKLDGVASTATTGFGDAVPHLSTKLPLNEIYLGRPYRNTRPSFLFPNTNALVTDSSANDFEKASRENLIGRLHTKFSLMSADLFQLVARTVGENYHKRVGRLIQIQYPSVEEAKTTGHKHYAGLYLLSEIRHMIQGMEYANILTAIADGYKDIERADLVQWEGLKELTVEDEIGDDYNIDKAEEIGLATAGTEDLSNDGEAFEAAE